MIGRAISLAQTGEIYSVIEIILPWPSSALSPNARGHWAQLARAKAAAKVEGKVLALAAQVPILRGMGTLAIEIEFCAPNAKRRDVDNLLASCKAQLDGIAEALGVDDSCFDPITLRRGEIVRGGQVIVRIRRGYGNEMDD